MEQQEIRDNEIRVVGGELPTAGGGNKRPRRGWVLIAITGAAVVAAAVALFFVLGGDAAKDNNIEVEQSYFEPQNVVSAPEPTVPEPLLPIFEPLSDTTEAFTQIKDTTINDVPLRIFKPHNATASLHLGRLSKSDKSIVFAAQAADIRRDNGGIVGAFVLKGEPRAWGLSKRGYAAIFGDTIIVGVADNSPLFERATEQGGYFFRQFALVDNGKLITNIHKNKAVRRALCSRISGEEGSEVEEIFVVESLAIESFHDFSQALIDLGVKNAIYLVGSEAWGWAVDSTGEQREFGIPRRSLPRNTSYLVWRK